MQLVGQSCVHCQQRISRDLDGGFCQHCGCATHSVCQQRAVATPSEGACPACAVPRAILEERAEAEETRIRESQSREGLHLALMGFAVLVGGLLSTICCTAAAGAGQLVIASGAILGGVSMIVAGFVRNARSGRQ